MSCCLALSCCPRAEDNVFGEVVTDGTVKKEPQFDCNCPITSKDRAEVAFRSIQADGKREKVRSYVQGLKQAFGEELSTPCMIYNATGETLFFEFDHDWEGHNWISYPSFIGNGQWGGFLHVAKPGTSTGSVGAVVYGKDKECTCWNWLLAWSNDKTRAAPEGEPCQNQPNDCESFTKVYTEFPDAEKCNIDWDCIKGKIKDTKSFAEKDRRYSIITVVQGDPLAIEAILTLEGVI